MINFEVAVPLVVALATPIALLLRRWQHRERMAALEVERQRPHADGERLERVERALEALTLEMERLGEGQRFVARALAERGAPAAMGRPLLGGSPRSITPH